MRKRWLLAPLAAFTAAALFYSFTRPEQAAPLPPSSVPLVVKETIEQKVEEVYTLEPEEEIPLPQYIKLNKPGGILFEQDGYSTVSAFLEVDPTTINDPIPVSNTTLIARLDVPEKLFKFAKIMGQTDRDSPNIVGSDFVKFFVDSSTSYQFSGDYSQGNTLILRNLISEAVQPHYLPNSQLVITSTRDSIDIRSYDLDENLIGDPDKEPIRDEKIVAAYGEWLNKRLREPFPEIQDLEREGTETHLTYLENGDSNRLASK